MTTAGYWRWSPSLRRTEEGGRHTVMLPVGCRQILWFSDGVRQVGAGGVGGVDVVVDGAEGVDCGVDRGRDEVDGVGGGLLGWGERGQSTVVSYRRGSVRVSGAKGAARSN
jgi:hypothetical protein